MTRRDKGSGSATKRPNGRYRLRVYVGRDPVTGTARYASKEVQAKNITQARKALAVFVAKQDESPDLGSNAPVRKLMEEWLAQLESDKKSPRTVTEARRTIDNLINPTLGDVPMSELTGRHVDEMNRKTADLLPSTRRRYHAVLAAALQQAVKWGWIDVNPVVRSNPPKLAETALAFPTPAEVTALINGMKSEVWKMAIRMGVVSGFRRGEICGLRWSDVTEDHIYVRRSVYRHGGNTQVKSTKSGRERRIPIEPRVAYFLKAWRAWCDERAAKVGLAVGPESYVLSSWPDCSRPLNPDTVSANVRRVTKGKMDHVHFHSLRHLAATNMLAAGVPVRDVAEALGHSDGGRLVLRIYGHPTSDQQRAAASAMATAITLPELTS